MYLGFNELSGDNQHHECKEKDIVSGFGRSLVASRAARFLPVTQAPGISARIRSSTGPA
jgi:hypothetical protein